MAPLAGECPFSVETRKGLTDAIPFSVETRKSLEASIPWSVRTDTILEGACPFSVETRKSLAGDSPFSVRTGVTIPAEARQGSLDVDHRVELVFPDGTRGPVASWSVTETISEGWQWNVELPYWVADALDYGEDDTFHVVGQDGLGNKLRTPPLVARPRSLGADIEQGETTTLSGTDRTSYLLDKEGFSYDTFRNVTANYILSQISGDAGVVISGAPSFGLIEEDVKQSNVAAVLNRYCSLAAYDWRIDEHGTVRCFPFVSSAESYRLRPSNIRREGNPLDRLNRWSFSKTSSLQDRKTFHWDSVGYKIEQLPNPLNSVTVQDISTLGFLSQIGIWNGDPTSNGKLIRWFNVFGELDFLSVPINGQDPATHISCYVNGGGVSEVIDASLYVFGTVPGAVPTGVELAFDWTWNAGGTGRHGGLWSEQGFPSQAWVQSRAQLYAWQRNRQIDVLNIEGPLDFSLSVVDLVDAVTRAIPGTPRTWPSARIESITHSGAAGQVPSSTLIAMVTPW